MSERNRTMDAVAIRPIPDGPEWAEAYGVMKQLRPHVSEAEFVARCREAGARTGYVLYGAFENGACVGVLGIRRLVDLLHGPHLYIDDLVVTEGARSRGIGARLLAFAESLASDAGGIGLRLCTGIDYWPARRFYEREGWTARAVVYKKGFPS